VFDIHTRETVYLHLPIALQNIACSFEGWRIQRARYSKAFSDLLQEAESRTFSSEEQIKAFRDERLCAFVKHCYDSVPFYRRQFNEIGLRPGDIRELNDLHKLPVLTKNDVQENGADLISETIPRAKQVSVHTSGTTGGGLRFVTTHRALQEQWATWWRYRRWHGLQLSTRCGYFGGRSVVPVDQHAPPFWRYNIPGKQILFSGYHMSPENLPYYLSELRRKQPPWLHGYPSLLALLAGHMLENRSDLGYRLQWVTTGAENLLPQQVDLISRAFGVKPRQHYGMAEAVANFSECEHGNLHVDEDFAAVEFLPNEDGGYKIIGTNLSNPATPLLRYDVQDNVSLQQGSCPCGRPGRIVHSIDGRAEDYVILKSGAKVGRMDHIFKDMINIHEAQIIQKHPGEIRIKIVRGREYSEGDKERLLSEVYKRVGRETTVSVEYVPALARSKTGKLRFVISELAKGKINQA